MEKENEAYQAEGARVITKEDSSLWYNDTELTVYS